MRGCFTSISHNPNADPSSYIYSLISSASNYFSHFRHQPRLNAFPSPPFCASFSALLPTLGPLPTSGLHFARSTLLVFTLPCLLADVHGQVAQGPARQHVRTGE